MRVGDRHDEDARYVETPVYKHIFWERGVWGWHSGVQMFTSPLNEKTVKHS
jgi:hypothetical protein